MNLTEKQLSYKNLFYAKQSYKNKKYKETILFLEQPLRYNPNWKTCWKWKGIFFIILFFILFYYLFYGNASLINNNSLISIFLFIFIYFNITKII